MTDLGENKNIILPKDTLVSTGKFLSYETHPIFNDPKQIIDKEYADKVRHLEQAQYFAASKAGDNVNTGKSEDDSVETLANLVTKISGLTPSIINQVMGKIIDGGTYTENVTVPSWGHLYGPAAMIIGNTTLTDNSTVTLKYVLPESGASNRSFTKSAGDGSANVEILDTWDVTDKNGVQCTAGTVNIAAKTVNFTGGAAIASGSTNTVNVDVRGNAYSTAGGFFAFHTSTGDLNVRANAITNADGNVFDISGASIDTIYANSLSALGAGHKVFGVSGGAVANVIVNILEENTASSESGANLNYLTNWYKRSGAVYTDYAIWRNSLNGILIEATDGAGIIELKAGGSSVFKCEPTKATVGVNELDLNGSGLVRIPQDFIDLSTTPVAITTFVAGANYKIRITDPGGGASKVAVFSLATGLVTGTSFTYTSYGPNNVGVTQSPAGTFTLIIGGGATYILVINISDNTATLAASVGTITGTTELRMIRLTP